MEKKEKDAQKSVFQILSSINANEHTEKLKQGSNEVTYLSWAWAWGYVKGLYPDASYTIYRDEHNRPFIEDPDFGLMCFTTVTIQGQTHEMWLPVMDGANKAMRRTPYTYKGKKTEWVNGQKTTVEVDKTVEAATMFDINKTIMRCLVKNLAMFGLGIYIYAGEDLPEAEVIAKKQEAVDRAENACKEATDCKDVESLQTVWNKYADLHADAAFKKAVTDRKAELVKPKQTQA